MAQVLAEKFKQIGHAEQKMAVLAPESDLLRIFNHSLPKKNRAIGPNQEIVIRERVKVGKSSTLTKQMTDRAKGLSGKNRFHAEGRRDSKKREKAGKKCILDQKGERMNK